MGLSDQLPNDAVVGYNGCKTLADLKATMLTRYVVNEDGTMIEGADMHFDKDTLLARLRINALDHGGDRNIRYGEIFRGRVCV